MAGNAKIVQKSTQMSKRTVNSLFGYRQKMFMVHFIINDETPLPWEYSVSELMKILWANIHDILTSSV